MPRKAKIRARAAELQAFFEAAGATPVETPLLQPAEVLLDLYGEDIRGRAYVTSDTLRGEQMLRPDFTVPVVQMHMDHGAEPARYTYSGQVFRRQEDDPSRDNEYLQVGYEVFDRKKPSEADAEVFALMQEVLTPLGLRAATGDIGILKAAVAGLETTERRKQALMRHIWRPRRFRQLLDRFSGRSEVPATRSALIANQDPMQNQFPVIGLRSEAEIAARIEALKEDAKAPLLSSGQVELIEALLGVREKLPFALEHLRDIAVDMPAITEAVFRLKDRIDALSKRDVDVGNLEFEASYGRTSMEYYDGFVFGFYAPGRADLPPVATGGRYDALTRVLGQGREIPAVGGVIRPDLVLQLEGGI
ncbi:ATP phosphoribosyltransferase regulatory subunit [Shimia thalassica]|uniref:Histidine--tRNA ligase n=1 Tax=Shimia thalassica TaxID=1715693 RepID=A0A0P1I1Y0_9RHOB|nr:ATP phosphoribosyltransferase regulatory subunit [Shimia thalassica]PHO05873.1 ATP phosphoribosyltransferase regulatory subunit [Rhodobacteraceae bacterium 4F10]MBU2942804.1 ATP phosphoribosyltransferase regulatory subunit [Shimia thalassica]MDO6480119.1 ATP phosphoribosyltransferase regulatory subunit [Shimia thalassica]MDO6484184.1 ATP phosphoribosyltransferase regulatory subunit [Shimia thalassica]MDO6502428.1 ATP phosphoribosyltransferase regulatory subunit [Shimia thalassica]